MHIQILEGFTSGVIVGAVAEVIIEAIIIICFAIKKMKEDKGE